MACEVFDSATSTHSAHAIGHVADDGNVYDTQLGFGESLERCVGHIASDGNVYTTARGFGEGTGTCVGHIGSNNNIYTNSKFQGDVLNYCAGHVEPDGLVYSTAAEVSAGSGYCVGRVRGGELVYGAAALLLLLRPGQSAGGTVESDGGRSGGGNYGGGSGGGGRTAVTGKRRLPPTIYKSEEELIKAFIARVVFMSLLAGLVGVLLANGNSVLGAIFGLLVGVGLSLLTLFGFTDRIICKFDTKHCRHSWLGVLFRQSVSLGLILPFAMLAVAALMVLSFLTGSPTLSLSIVYLIVIVSAGLALGKVIKRWLSK